MFRRSQSCKHTACSSLGPEEPQCPVSLAKNRLFSLPRALSVPTWMGFWPLPQALPRGLVLRRLHRFLGRSQHLTGLDISEQEDLDFQSPGITSSGCHGVDTTSYLYLIGLGTGSQHRPSTQPACSRDGGDQDKLGSPVMSPCVHYVGLTSRQLFILAKHSTPQQVQDELC